MSRIPKQILCGYLALCLALAGAVGISPLLHLWVEHGGYGSAHSHWAGLTHQSMMTHAATLPSGHPHSHPLPRASQASADYKQLLLNHGNAFALPTFRELCRILAFLVPGGEDHPSPGTSHEHHSLAQLMAAGLAEAFTVPILLPFATARLSFDQQPLASEPLSSNWDAQASPRGPPLRLVSNT